MKKIKMKQLKVGQKITFKTLAELCKSGWEDSYLNDENEPCLWHPNCDECVSLYMMHTFVGREFTIEKILDNEYFTIIEDINKSKYIFSPLMVAKIN